MPLVDMSLEQLLTDTGRSPRPADFDEFWDCALAEMRVLDPQVEFVPYPLKASFAERLDLYLVMAW